MQMTMRWYGSQYDTVTLQQIRQTAYVKGVISTLYNKMPGELWTYEEIMALKNEVEAAGLTLPGIESVNISDAIKTGAPERDKDIDAYIKTLENLGKADIHMVCYNFMPVFDWTRTELARMRKDGSTVLAYNQKTVDSIDPAKMFDSISNDMNGTVMPGWEPERMAKVKQLFEEYADIDEEKLFANLKYFLEAIMPVCDKYDINMAIHPDDPSWSVFGLPRIIIHALKGRIHFAHIRNLQFNDGMNDFEESAHLSSDGTFDMHAIMKALYDTGFDGIIRPDHGRMIWGEKAMPGYGLYDRALGAAYLCGLWESIVKENQR